jgi:phage gpG-like protein
MNVNIRINVDTSEVEKYLLKMEHRATDFRSIFRWARRELEEAQRENFATDGAASGKKWASLDDEYARWKLSEYGPLPTLVRSGDLYREVTFFRGPPNDIGFTQATYGTDLPYARFHQTGTSKMAQRTILFVPKLFAERMGNLVLKYLVYGDETGVSVSRLRNLLRT